MEFQDTNVITDEAVNVYRELSRLPALSLARLFNSDTPGHERIYSEWTQPDLERSEKIKFSKNHVVHFKSIFDTPPTDIGTQQLSAESPSGKYRAVLRKVKNKKGEEKQYIEVWSDACKLHNIDVENLEQHGKVYDDATFSSWEWSYSETHLLYVAEKKRPKAKSFFDKKAAEEERKPDHTGDHTRGLEHVFVDDWGEVMSGRSVSVVCVLDVEDGIVSTLDNLPDTVAAGQAIWCKDDSGVVCVGWQTEPYHLGIYACPIRKNAIYHIDLKTSVGSCTVIGSSDAAVRSPRFNHDFSHLVYLENRVGGPHMQCSKLVMCDWSLKGVVPVIDIVHKHNAEIANFPGVYTDKLPKRCFAEDNKRLVFSTRWRSKMEIVVVDIHTGSVTRLTNDETVGCWSVLDVHKDLIVAARSSPSMPHQLMLGSLPSAGTESEGCIEWTALDEAQPQLNIHWSIHPVTVPSQNVHPDYGDLDYEVILMQPPQAHNPPLVAFLHGGPHSVTTADYSRSLAGMVQCGFAVIAVNYRGSYGFGQNNIDCLPGRCGDVDVKDCQHAVELFATERRFTQVVVCGGSHGGFLTAHLVGQYPDYYKAAVCRNPVINITSMLGTTDIPDWCVVSGTGQDFTETEKPSAELYSRLWSCSPISHVDKMKTPMMLMIGTDDKRVPPKQGHELRKALQARKVPVKVLEYSGNGHALSNVDTEADSFVNIILWFYKHLDMRKPQGN